LKLEKGFTKGGAHQPKHSNYGRGRGSYNQYNQEGKDGFEKGVSKPYDKDRKDREPLTEEDLFKRQEANLLR
jgi:hypothetical protein